MEPDLILHFRLQTAGIAAFAVFRLLRFGEAPDWTFWTLFTCGLAASFPERGRR